MKKVFLVGQLNQTVSSVNRHLSTRFSTQLCVDALELVKGMTKVFEPDMIVISLVGVGTLDSRILNYFCAEYSQVPVLLLGTVEECKYYRKYYEQEQIDFITRPTTLSGVMRKCLMMLRMEISEPESVVIEPKEETEDRKKRILAVDDSGILLRSVKAMLEKTYEISVATDGMMALKQAIKKKPDLILLDYEMPKMDGKETLEELRRDEELKDIPVVFLTGIAERENIMAVLKLKPEGYLLKPIDQQRLVETIEKVLTGTV